jgi:hypothetical protein
MEMSIHNKPVAGSAVTKPEKKRRKMDMATPDSDGRILPGSHLLEVSEYSKN